MERVQFETSQKYIIEIEAMNKKELEFKNHSCLDHPDVKEEKARMKFLDQDLKRKMKEYEQATVMVTTRYKLQFDISLNKYECLFSELKMISERKESNLRKNSIMMLQDNKLKKYDPFRLKIISHLNSN